VSLRYHDYADVRIGYVELDAVELVNRALAVSRLIENGADASSPAQLSWAFQ